MNEKDVVLAFWQAMESNDFYAVGEWLSDDFELYWPQSGELIQGRESFGALNSAYPAEGLWRFTINSLVHEREQVVTDVSVTDGTRQDRVIPK